MRIPLLFIWGCLSTTQLTVANILEYDGSGDLKSTKPAILNLKERIRASFNARTANLHRQHRTKTHVKRMVRAVLPGLVKTYLDFHLPEFVHLYVSELFQSDDVIIPTCTAQEARIEKLEGNVGRLKSRMNHMGRRVDELEKVVEQYHIILKKNLNSADAKNKTFLETEKEYMEDLKIADQNDVELLDTEDVTLRDSGDVTQLDTEDVTPLDSGDVTLLKRRDPVHVTPRSANISCVTKFMSTVSSSPTRVIAVSIADPQFYILENGTKSEFPIQSGKVRSLVYDPTARNIIWSNYSSGNRGIFLASLRRPAKIKRLSGMSSEGLAVDPCKRWLFFTTISPRPTISRMTTRGRHYRQIKEMRNYAPYMYSVALDPDRGLIYTCHHSVLVQTSYNGKKQKELVSQGSAIFAVTIDLATRMLYYGSWGEIKRLSLGDGVINAVVKVGSSPRNLLYHDNLLYSDKSKNVQVYDISSQETIDLGKLNDTTISICIIP